MNTLISPIAQSAESTTVTQYQQISLHDMSPYHSRVKSNNITVSKISPVQLTQGFYSQKVEALAGIQRVRPSKIIIPIPHHMSEEGSGVVSEAGAAVGESP